MKLLKGILITVLLVAVLLCAAVLIWKEDLKKAVLPEVKKLEVLRVKVQNDSALAQLELTLQNRPFVRYELDRVELKAMNDSIVLMEYLNDSSIVLKPLEKRTIPISFMIPIKKIIKRIRKLQSVDSTDIVITGRAVFNTRAGEVELPIEERLVIPVPVPPKIRIAEVQYLGSQEGSFDFNVLVDVTNQSDKPIEVEGIRYDFKGEDLISSEGAYGKPLRIKPGETVQAELPVRLETDSRLKLLSKIVFDNDEINYRFKMTGTITKVAGIDQEIPVEFAKTGRMELVDKTRPRKFEIHRKRDK